MYLSIYLPPSIHISSHLCIHPFIHLLILSSVRPFIHASAHLSMHPSMCISVLPPTYLFNPSMHSPPTHHPPVHPFIHPSTHLSTPPPPTHSPTPPSSHQTTSEIHAFKAFIQNNSFPPGGACTTLMNTGESAACILILWFGPRARS